MGVYIKGIEKPKDGKQIWFDVWNETSLTSHGIIGIEDLIEIDLVRCGECKWWNEETHGCNRNPSVNAWWETDFCSYGERK